MDNESIQYNRVNQGPRLNQVKGQLPPHNKIQPNVMQQLLKQYQPSAGWNRGNEQNVEGGNQFLSSKYQFNQEPFEKQTAYQQSGMLGQKRAVHHRNSLENYEDSKDNEQTHKQHRNFNAESVQNGNAFANHQKQSFQPGSQQNQDNQESFLSMAQDKTSSYLTFKEPTNFSDQIGTEHELDKEKEHFENSNQKRQRLLHEENSGSAQKKTVQDTTTEGENSPQKRSVSEPQDSASHQSFMDMNYYLNEMIIHEICQKQVKKENADPNDKKENFENDLEKQKQKFILQKKQFNSFDKKGSGFTISLLQSKSKHVQRNKLSDKFSRRDVQYYDLYHLQEPKEDYQRFKCEGGYPYTPFQAKIKELYGDLAYQDFNVIFKCQGDIVEKQYGQTVKVNLSINVKEEGVITLKREVKENLALRKNDMEMVQQKKKAASYKDDYQLQHVDMSLKAMAKEFGKSKIELADIFCKVSGRLNKVRDYLKYEKSQKDSINQGNMYSSQVSVRSNALNINENGVSLEGSGIVTWSFLEDLALMKPEDSPEFQVLIAAKGLDEIEIRRDFLDAKPKFLKLS